MRNFYSLFLLVFFLSTFAFGKTYQTDHYIIYSAMDSRYVSYLEKNIEGFYDNMVGEFFPKGWAKPLKIYYSESQSDTQKLLPRNKVGYGIYIAREEAIYTHRRMKGGDLSGIGTVFHEIGHHFVRNNYKRPPDWFDEGLVCVLAEQSRIANGKLSIGHPNPWRERILKGMIESGYEIDVKKMTSMSNRKFNSDNNNYHPIRALFLWLYKQGVLKDYMGAVREKGYRLSVLEELIGKKREQINNELLAFIKTECYAGACLQGAYLFNKPKHKRVFLEQALQLKPDYCPAQLELARVDFGEGALGQTREGLQAILKDEDSIEYKDALKLWADCHYKEKDFAKATACYLEALEHSEYSEYRYQLFYRVGNCYHHLREPDKAKEWYGRFLEENWEPDRLVDWCEYARKYLSN